MSRQIFVFLFVILVSVVHRSAALAVGLKKVAILGASGYTGAELMRLLTNHPGVSIEVLTADRSAGQTFKSIYPQFSYRDDLPMLTKWEDSQKAIEDCDIAFCCLPHGTTQEIIATLAKSKKVKIVDLSADFRLRDLASYEQWYGKPHAAPDLQPGAVYCIPEINRADVTKDCRILANPGCYPTAAQLPLVPLLKAGLITGEDIIIDAKSGTTGAGRAPKEAFLFCEVADGIAAYGVASHRHAPEIEQGLSDAAGSDVIINFTPHLMPMSRGILESIYVKLAPGKTAKDLKDHLQMTYKNEPFVHILEGGALPQTRHIRGSNNCFINVVQDRVPGRAIIISAIDNLVKGASGQAIQNMNIMLGFPETTALNVAPMFP